ncbi:MAG: flagellar hook-length control protein FliK [Burkholderiaceae bacterium]
MSLETSAAGSRPPAPEKNAATAGAARQARAQEGAAPPGAFGSLLASMEPDPEPPGIVGDASVARGTVKPGQNAKDAPEDESELPQADARDLAANLLIPPATVPGMAVAPAATQAGSHAAGTRVAFSGKGLRSSAVAGSADRAQDPSGATKAATTTLQTGSAQSLLRQAGEDDAALQSQALSSSKGALARAAEARSVAEGARSDGRNSSTALAVAAAGAGTPARDGGAWLASGLLGARSTERSASRTTVSGSAGTTLTGAWTPQALDSASATSANSFTPDVAAAAAPESAVAEKLNYWIARGVQNAELQLDAFGGGSVEVRIAVHGQQTQIDFRSDQPEARRILQDAMPQLRDLLADQGLSLSSGFVGTSAGQDPQARAPERQLRSARVVVSGIETPAIARRPGAGVATGRSVDLFV